jgi:hypothetical protein
MTAMIVPFVGKSKRTARENLTDYIAAAKRTRFFTGPHALNWDDESWDFSHFYAKVGQNRRGLVAHFTTVESTRKGNRAPDAVDFGQPYLDAVKAITIEFLRTTGEKAVTRIVTVLRIIEKAFRDLNLIPDICGLTGAVLDWAQQLIIDKYKDAWNFSRILDRVANEFVNPARLVPVPLLWKNSVSYKAPKRNDAVNKDGGAAGDATKLPHLKAILDLSGVFHSSSKPEDVVITSWFAFAMFAPERVNEILSLPINCGTEMDGVFGISWRPLKGAQPKTNFAVTEEWAAVARKAIERLTKLGEKPRRAAQWYEDNPDQLYVPPGYEHLRGKSITLWEASQILGRTRPLPQGSRFRRSLEHVGNTTDITRGGANAASLFVKLYSFESLEKYVLKSLPDGWPYIDRRHRLKASQGLFCLPANLMRGNTDTEWNIPEFITDAQISHELGTKPTGKTIFARHDLLDPRTGKAWKLSTHQPRHLLNTLAQSKHVSQELIAFWSGRKSSRQNDYYNHMPQEYYLEEWLSMDSQSTKSITVLGPLNDKIEERSRREMISRDDALRLELGSTITTRFGLCRHDYSLTMCPRDKDCISCGENSFLKGNQIHLDEARIQRKIETKATEEARKAVETGQLGAEKWLARHEQRARRWQLAIDHLTDPANPDGSIITLPPDEHPQTRTGLAFNIRGTNPRIALVPDTMHVELDVLNDLWGEEEDF